MQLLTSPPLPSLPFPLQNEEQHHQNRVLSICCKGGKGSESRVGMLGSLRNALLCCLLPLRLHMKISIVVIGQQYPSIVDSFSLFFYTSMLWIWIVRFFVSAWNLASCLHVLFPELDPLLIVQPFSKKAGRRTPRIIFSISATLK